MNSQSTVSAHEPHSSSSITLILFCVGIVVALLVAWLARVILLLLFAAIVVAVLLTAVVDWIQSKLKLRRGFAFALLICVVSAIVLLGLWLIGPNVVEQISDLQRELPPAAQKLVESINGYRWGHWMLAQLSGYSQVSNNISDAMTRIGGMVVSTATALAGLMLVAFLGLYLAAEPNVYVSGIRRAIPVRYREVFDDCARNGMRFIRWWLLSQMLSMAAVGTLVFAGLFLLGVPLAATLGMIAALFTFIPNVGPILSVVPAALLAVAISPAKGLLTVSLFLVVHFLEGNLITPLLERKIVRLPPALTMVTQLMLAVLAGPLGLALAAPLTAASLGVFQTLLPPNDAIDPKPAAENEAPLSVSSG